MKNNYYYLRIWLIGCIVLSGIMAFSQSSKVVNGYMITFGERPPVNFKEIPEEAFIPGTFMVKFSDAYSGKLDEGKFSKSAEGTLVTGIEPFDALCKTYKVTHARCILTDLYSVPGKQHEYKERHKAWGFDLWFEVYTQHQGKLTQVTEAFGQLECIETAEPRLKIKLVEPIPSSGGVESNDGGNSRWSTNDPYFNLQYYLKNTGQTIGSQAGTAGMDINIEPAWDFTRGNPDVVVAVMDDRMKHNHADLALNIWPGVGPQGAYSEFDSHSTAVGGIIAAVSNNNTGIAGIAGGTGISEGVRLMSINILGTNPYGTPAAYIWAADNGAAISQNSWTYENPLVFNNADLNAMDYFNAHGGGTVMNGGLIIFSAGNSDNSRIYYPSAYSGTFAVGGIDNRGFKAYFSSHAPFVEVSACAVEIYSTSVNNNNDIYEYDGGTSFASPQASGIAALMLSYAPGKLTPAKVREILRNTADPIDHLNEEHAGLLGTGKLNAYAALRAVKDFLDGLENPPYFIARAQGPLQIDLQWTKNTQNHEVMIVFNTSNTFGSPANGTIYNIGDGIPGGGTVIYRGSLTRFSHTPLEPGTYYFYRAFSYNAASKYSSGRTIVARTTPAITGIALYETFEDNSPTRGQWTQQYLAGAADWTYAVGSSGGAITTAFKGTYNARFVSQSGTNTPRTLLISPSMDLSGFSSPVVDFWYAQQLQSTFQNQLRVYYRTSPQASWVQLAHYTGNVNTWTNVVLTLPNKSSTYQIAFEGINNGGHANVLDEIIVREATSNASATYTAGDLPTHFPADGFWVSSCPGTLTISIPQGAEIVSTNVSYSMTALNQGWKSEQRSRLECTSPGGIFERSIFSGTGDTVGTQQYSRFNLNIANGVTGGGNIQFALHAHRTWSPNINDGCNTTYNRVDNNTWTVTVKYHVPPPAIHYTPLSGTTNQTGSRDLNSVHISTLHPDGIASGTNAPRIYWRVNNGQWQSAATTSNSGNFYNFTIGTSNLAHGDVVQYFVIAQSAAGTVVAKPGTGLVATSVHNITTYPTNPHSYTVNTAGPLSGNYLVSQSKFKELSGLDITFEKVIRKVWQEVWEEEPAMESESEQPQVLSRGDDSRLVEIPETTTPHAPGKPVLKEVEEITWIPMLNGKVYDGPLYVEHPDPENKEIRSTYATLTAAITDLNNRGVSGPVTFLLNDATYSTGETFPLNIQITSQYQPSASSPVTIRPNSNVTSTISGSVANGPIIRIRNTSYVTIDGSNSGGSDRSLTITNTNTTGPQVVQMVSDSQSPITNITLKNCIINNGSQASSAIIIMHSDGSAGYFNDITIQNNSIRQAYIGIFVNAVPVAGNGNGLVIQGNNLDQSGTNSIRLIGIYVQGVDGATISGNTISNMSNNLNEVMRGIMLASGTIRATVSGNTISNLSKTSTGTSASIIGISGASGTATARVTISNNTISNLTNHGALTLFSGIVNFAPNVTISGNTVQTMTQNTSNVAFWGIVTSGGSNVLITGNTVTGITTATQGTASGISIQGNSTTVKVAENRISNIKNSNSNGWTAIGLQLASTINISDVLVYNNFIWDVAGYGRDSISDCNGYGIRIQNGGGYRLYYNSVHLATNQTLTTGIPACLMIGNNRPSNSLDLRNNIFSMAATVGANRCAVICNAANTAFSTINHNVYRSTGTRLGYIGGSYRNNISEWRTGTGQDGQSQSLVPDFVSNTDLHISGGFSSPLAGIGTPLNAVITDIDGEPRNNPPFIGADEYGRSWTGAQNTAWNNNNNWSPNVPSANNQAVRIPANVPNFPDITTSAVCGNLMIEEGAQVTVSPGGSLTVAGKLINNAGKEKLVIKSTSSGTGSLIHNTTGVDATVERYIPASGYHQVSIPVTQTSNPVSGWFLWSYLYRFDTDNQQWVGMGAPTNTPLNVRQGYLIYKYPGPSKWSADTTYAFRGTLQSGTFFADVSYPNTGGNFNLVPNPYPSAIDWNASSGWTRTNIAGSYWVWRHASGNYGVWNGTSGTLGVTKDIPVGQSFFVQATAANPVLAFNNNVRLHSTQSFYKETLPNQLRLTALARNYQDEVIVHFTDASSAAFHPEEDAMKMYGQEDAPQLYTLSTDQQKLSINVLPLSDKKMEIPLALEMSEAGEVTLEASSVDSFDPQVTIYLWDRLTGTMTNLRETNQYRFQHLPSFPAERFDIILNSAVAIHEMDPSHLTAHFTESGLQINFYHPYHQTSLAVLYTPAGQQVASQIIRPGINHLPLPALSRGVYVLKISGNHHPWVQKLIRH